MPPAAATPTAASASTSGRVAFSSCPATDRSHDGKHALYGRATAHALDLAVLTSHRSQLFELRLAIGTPKLIYRHVSPPPPTTYPHSFTQYAVLTTQNTSTERRHPAHFRV